VPRRQAGAVIEVGVEVIRVQELVAQDVLAGLGAVERRLELLPDLLRDLVARALFRGLRDERAGRVPVRDVDRDESADLAVAVRAAEQAEVAPELRLRDRGEGPRRVGIE